MNRKQKTRLKRGIVIKIIAIVASIYGMIGTSFSMGIKSISYFTNLSNIWIDTILFVFLVLDIKDLMRGRSFGRSNGLYIIKYVFTVSITITFLVFMFILAPTQPEGFIMAYLGSGAGSFCLHFLTPVIAIIDFFVFDHGYRTRSIHCFYAIVPALCYLVAVIILGQCGMRWMNGMITPYNFINYGAPTGWFGFDPSRAGVTTLGIGVAYIIPVLVIIFLAIGYLYLKILDQCSK